MTMKYRYGFGNFFILLDEAYMFTEENYEESVFFYTDSIAHFYNFFNLSTNNEYFEYYYFNESSVQNKTVFFYALIDKLNVKEQNKATLEKTFLKGPQCFMLYELQEKEIASFSLEKDAKQEFAYNFPSPVQLSYCSISLETRFFLSQEVEITMIGENINSTTIINPPLGKYKSCEYLCSFPSGNITGVEVKTNQNFLNRVLNEAYNVELRVIKK